jgi:hypothetical protein
VVFALEARESFDALGEAESTLINDRGAAEVAHAVVDELQRG